MGVMKNAGRWRSAVGEEKVDTLLRGRHGHHILRGAQRIRSGSCRGRRNGWSTL